MVTNYSGLVLAGGRSSRMRRDKAALVFHGVSLLQHQVNKLRSLGLTEILVAGSAPCAEGAVSVPDIYPHRGPLSGIHAGLNSIHGKAALVLPVDMPLIPIDLINRMLERHTGGVTILEHEGFLEPLIGIYDRALCPHLESILTGENTSVRSFLSQVGFQTYHAGGELVFYLNCNCPDDYEKAVTYTSFGIQV